MSQTWVQSPENSDYGTLGTSGSLTTVHPSSSVLGRLIPVVDTVRRLFLLPYRSLLGGFSLNVRQGVETGLYKVRSVPYHVVPAT